MLTNDSYRKALIDLKSAPIVMPRDMKTKELINYSFGPMHPSEKLITIKGFETNFLYAEEEMKWYMSGSNRIDFSELIYKTWEKYSDDGVTVNSAYGARIWPQWKWIKDELRKDPSSRRAIINLNFVSDKLHTTKDFPCTMSLHYMIRENHLHCITHMRSQDIYYGTRNDIYCFMTFQELLANELNLPCGFYFHNCDSLHIYEKHFKKLELIK